MSDISSARASELPFKPGFRANLRFDVLSGFLVFLIAMPLCLGIAKASQYPPIAGIWTAVIGGILTTFISNSQLTIKGPAAGLIVVAASSVISLGEYAVPVLPVPDVAAMQAAGKTDADIKTELQARQVEAGYPLALGAAFVAGIIQILFGLFRAGTLGELVPLTPVHGMLAAIGITIIAKQLSPMLGMPSAAGAPINIILGLPTALQQINPTVATVGLTSLAILILFPSLKARFKFLAPVPAQVIVLALAIPMGISLGLTGTSLVSVPNIIYSADPQSAVRDAFTCPDFSAVATAVGIQAVMMFCLIASIESLLSSQAIDMIDPWRRKTNQNRDLLATGVGNTVCAAVGALPMISEIVRSKANIDNGARTKFADMFHGIFLLAFVLVLPFIINIIPMAALGAMLVFVGFRLASPKEFVHTLRIGPEQLIVFLTTIIVTLSTDLLIGVVSGIVLKALIHVLNGAPLSGFWRPGIQVAERDDMVVLAVKKAAVFSNWLSVQSAIRVAAEGREEVLVDLSETRLVDHSVMEKLHILEKEFADEGKRLRVIGLESHRPLSTHPLAARKASRNSGVSATSGVKQHNSTAAS